MAEAMAREQAEAAEELRRLAEENASWTQRSMQGQLNWAGFLERERQENAAVMAKTQAEMASEIRRQQNEAEFLRQLAEGEAKLAEQAAQEQLMQIESELLAQVQDQDDNYPYVRRHH